MAFECFGSGGTTTLRTEMWERQTWPRGKRVVHGSIGQGRREGSRGIVRGRERRKRRTRSWAAPGGNRREIDVSRSNWSDHVKVSSNGAGCADQRRVEILAAMKLKRPRSRLILSRSSAFSTWYRIRPAEVAACRVGGPNGCNVEHAHDQTPPKYE